MKRWRRFSWTDNLSADAETLRARAARCMLFFLIALGVALGKPGLLAHSFPYASRPVDAVPMQIGDGHDIWRAPIVSEAAKRVEQGSEDACSAVDGSAGDQLVRDLGYSTHARPVTAPHSKSDSFGYLARAPPSSC